MTERVLVFGSLPPHARDLDLLVRPAAREAAERALAEAAFERRDSTWALFRDCSVCAVDLVATSDWHLPPEELEALFVDARPIDGLERLVRPAPQHALLILARAGFAEKRRRRLEAVLAEDPAAWERARERAGAWSAERQLAELYAAASGNPSRRLPRPRRGGVVTLSGVDGSGKSSQAQSLAHALEQLGYESVVEWTPIASNAPVAAMSDMTRRVLRAFRWLGPVGRLERHTAAGGSILAREAGADRDSLRAIFTVGWSAAIAIMNAWSHSRAVLGHVGRGRIVVYDRYTLDSIVILRYLWGGRGEARFQSWLVQTLSPRPLCSFFLDVAPETALARKQDQWDLRALRRLVALYRDEYDSLGVHRLDGELPREELCAEIAAVVWRRLG